MLPEGFADKPWLKTFSAGAEGIRSVPSLRPFTAIPTPAIESGVLPLALLLTRTAPSLATALRSMTHCER
jgi:hypothetical protein